MYIQGGLCFIFFRTLLWAGPHLTKTLMTTPLLVLETPPPHPWAIYAVTFTTQASDYFITFSGVTPANVHFEVVS